MSADFAVFDPASAPRDGKQFRVWLRDQSEQPEWMSDTPDPDTLSAPLRRWYEAMTAKFPDSNRTTDESRAAIDYSYTEYLVHCSISSKQGNEAWRAALDLAASNGVGTYDMMSDDGRHNGCIVFPDGPLPNAPSWISRLFGKTKG